MASHDLTKTALLVCEREDKPTRHHFTDVQPINSNEELGYDLLYECEECGKVRGWGNVETLHLELKKTLGKLVSMN